MDKKIAFIGTGNMGGAIIRAACRVINPKQVIITDFLLDKATALSEEAGCLTAPSNLEAAEMADCIMLCVKPQVMAGTLEDIAPVLESGYRSGKPKILYSIAAGISIATIRAHLEIADYPIIRIMPNTPALIGKGLMLLGCDKTVSQTDIDDLRKIISGCGTIDMLDERLFDQATASASCSPAFVYMFIEALADGGVSIGLSREQAQTYAASAVMGAAAMVLETDSHPGALKDMVCSPAGSTIEGVTELERRGFRSAAIEAVIFSYKRNLELGK